MEVYAMTFKVVPSQAVCGLCFVCVLLFLGCGEPVATCPEHQLQKGQTAAKGLRNGELADFELVFLYQELDEGEYTCFADGFTQIYAESNEQQLASKYLDLISDSIKGDHFKTAFELGRRHALEDVTDSQVQSNIRGSVGLSGSITLGWKAGYIKGYAESKKKGDDPADKKKSYKQAKSMYDALRAASGVD